MSDDWQVVEEALIEVGYAKSDDPRASLARLREREAQSEKDRLWVNESRTVMVRLWATGTMEVSTRKDPSYTWGPPVYLKEEK